MRATLVIIHTSSGVAGLITGLAVLAPPRAGDGRGWLRWAYLLCVAILLATMIALIVLDWDGLDIAARVTFLGLAALAAFMLARILAARREAAVRSADWQGRYMRHIEFTYIALWEGFVILPALNLPLPQVSVPVVAVGVFLVLHTLLGRYRARVLAA